MWAPPTPGNVKHLSASFAEPVMMVSALPVPHSLMKAAHNTAGTGDLDMIRTVKGRVLEPDQIEYTPPEPEILLLGWTYE